jgi:CP family cyanate transporter-like MFS transporter
LLGIVLCDGVWVVVSAAAAGLGAAVTFIVSFGLPAILSPPGEVHRMAGGMFTISYSIAVIVPVLCGASWDLTGLPWTAFMPIAACAIIMTIFGTMLSARNASSER